MANEGISPGAGISATINEQKFQKDTQKSVEGIKSQLKKINEGVSKSEDLSDLGEKILKQLKIISQTISGNNAAGNTENASAKTNGIKALKDTAQEVASTGVSDEDEKVDDGGAEAKEGKAPTSKVDINDLKDLSTTEGLGFAVLYWKLDEISNKLGKGKGGGGSKGKGIGNFFKGLLKGAAGLALLASALIIFAGSLGIFNGIEWGPALAGLASFALFTITMTIIAKAVGKEIDTFLKFTIGSLVLSVALGTFGISIQIVSQVFSGKPVSIFGKEILPAIDIKGALIGIGLFSVFLLGTTLIAKIANKDSGTFIKFAVASGLMSLSLAAFGLAIGIVGTIMSGGKILGISFPKDGVVPALQGLGLFTVFTLSVALLSHLVSKNKKNWFNFAIGASLMSGALIVFSMALTIPTKILGEGIDVPILGHLQADPVAAAEAVGLFAAFVLSFAILVKIANGQAKNLLKFTAVSMLMAVGLITFSIAIGVTAVIASGKGGKIGPLEIPESANFVNSMIGLGMMTIYLVAFTGIAALLTLISPFIAPGVVILLGLAGSILLMGMAMTMTALVVSGGNADDPETGKKSVFPGISLEIIGQFFTLVGAFIDGFGHIGWGAAAGALLKAVIITPLTVLIISIATCMNLAILAAKGIVALGGAGATVVMFDELDLVIDRIVEIPVGKAAKALLLSAIMTPLSALITVISTVLIATSLASKAIMAVGGVNDKMFDGLLVIILKLSAIADVLGKDQIKLTKQLSKSLIPIVRAVDKMADLVIKIAEFSPGGKNNQSIDSAMIALRRIVGSGRSGDGLIGMVNLMADELDFVGVKAFASLASIGVITNAIDKMVYTITLTSKIKDDTLFKGKQNIANIGNFIVEISSTLSRFNIPRKELKAVRELSALVNGTGKYKDEGLLQLVEGIEKLKGAEGDPNSITEIFNNLIKSFEGFSSIEKKSLKNISKIGKAFQNLRLGTLSIEMEKFTNSLKLTKELAAEASTSPFSILSNSINLANNSLVNLNNSLDQTLQKLNDISKKAEKMPLVSEEKDISNVPSNSSTSTSKTTTKEISLKTLEANQKDMKKSLENVFNILKEFKNSGMTVKVKNGYSI